MSLSLRLLGRRGSTEILLELHNKNAQRFKDLKKIVLRESTLSARLHELESLGLIESVPIQARHEKYFAYRLTKRGNKIAQELEKILAIA